jgi:hypothetical protein
VRTISIFGLEDEADRGLSFRRDTAAYVREEISAEVLKERLTAFLESMRDVIAAVPGVLGEFSLDSVTLSAEISAKGTVSLLGTGGEIAGKGGLSFMLKRPLSSKAEGNASRAAG